jgi:hypothetical protein
LDFRQQLLAELLMVKSDTGRQAYMRSNK